MNKILLSTWMIWLCVLSGVSFAASTNLSWQANTESDLAGYNVYREDTTCSVFGTASATRKPKALASVGKVTTYVDSAVPDNVKDVCYWLTAKDVSGNESVFSVPASKTFVVAVKLPAPTTFTYVNGVFSWSAVEGATGYLLRVHELGTPYGPCDLAGSWAYCNEVGTLVGTSKSVTLKPNVQYDVWVQAHDVLGTPGETKGLMATYVPDVTPPAEVKGLQITKNTEDQIIIVASSADCTRVTTTTKGTMIGQHSRVITCVK